MNSINTQTKGFVKGQLITFIVVSCLIVAFDQIIKVWIREVLPLGVSTPLIPGICSLTHVENTGAAFGIGEGAQVFYVLLALAIFVAVGVLLAKRSLPYSLVISLTFVGAGGIGNMIDRIVQGSVTDFFNLSFISFPVFNIADIFVTLGVVFSLIFYLKFEGKTRE